MPAHRAHADDLLYPADHVRLPPGPPDVDPFSFTQPTAASSSSSPFMPSNFQHGISPIPSSSSSSSSSLHAPSSALSPFTAVPALPAPAQDIAVRGKKLATIGKIAASGDVDSQRVIAHMTTEIASLKDYISTMQKVEEARDSKIVDDMRRQMQALEKKVDGIQLLLTSSTGAVPKRKALLRRPDPPIAVPFLPSPPSKPDASALPMSSSASEHLAEQKNEKREGDGDVERARVSEDEEKKKRERDAAEAERKKAEERQKEEEEKRKKEEAAAAAAAELQELEESARQRQRQYEEEEAQEQERKRKREQKKQQEMAEEAKKRQRILLRTAGVSPPSPSSSISVADTALPPASSSPSSLSAKEAAQLVEAQHSGSFVGSVTVTDAQMQLLSG